MCLNLKRSLSALYLFSLVGCAHSMIIKSEPSVATVSIQMGNSPRSELGKTPIDISYKDLEKIAPSASVTGEMIPVTFEKEGFNATTLMVPLARFGVLSTSVTAKLKAKADEEINANKLLRFLHNAQKFANSGDYTRALDEVNKAIDKDSQFIRALSMKGAIFYAQRRYDDSLVWYEKALALDNGFDEVIKMISQIKKEKVQN